MGGINFCAKRKFYNEETISFEIHLKSVYDMKTSCIVRMNIKFKPLSCNREFELGTGMTCLILFGQWGHAGAFPKTPTLRSGGFKLSYEIRQTRLSNFIFHKTGLPREIGFFVHVYFVVEVVFLDFEGDIQGLERCIRGFEGDILAFTGPILDFTTHILKFTFFTQFWTGCVCIIQQIYNYF